MTSICHRPRWHAADFFINTRFGVIHEDAEILVLDKPSPLAVHPVGAYAELNLHSLLKKDPRWADTKLHFAHRLDAETSGVILAAKSYESARAIGKDFLNGRVHKIYRALVFGIPALRSDEIRHPLGYDKSSGFQTVRTWDPVDGEAAATRYSVIESFETPLGAYALLELEPLTGRTHQIRAHLSFIGHPVVGDKIYLDLNIFSRYVMQGIDEAMLERVKLPRLALHACRLEITHPSTRERAAFSSPAPDFAAGVRERDGLQKEA